ncbi:MAG TPA: DUF1553 domain-containing protein, partial [Pirellulaceae bacterium]|nr:DUF1553 domain-containing protein [Pirellulaceae bacterium]
WTVVTFDLWRDIGEFTLTGCAPTCDRGDEALFDMLILGPSLESLDAYKPGRPVTPVLGGAQSAVASNGSPSSTPGAAPPFGDAFTDANNPIRKLFHGERLDLWSLKKPVRVELRDDKRHPIDQFVASQAEADRRTLIRRLTYDLHGLPPTPPEIDSFQNDRSPNAYAKLVDRLLDSPRYGERQAQLWLDVVRYADTNGYERDEFRPLAWQYRDYVIRAFNADKPYDRFVLEQLAGDELVAGPPRTTDEADALIATGYLRLGQWDSTAAIFQEEPRLRAEMMADLTNTTASAFLGLTYSCCQCHDHKYDPLSQADHYRLRAFFAGLKSRDDMVVELADELAVIQQHNSELDRKIAPRKAELDKLKKDDEKTKARREELGRQISELESKKRQSRVAWAASDDGAAIPATHVFYQGDFHSPRTEVGPGYPSVLFPNSVSLAPPRSDTSGRRTALARWIVAPENPWTARVMVNRIWQQHFGVGLVATPNDFGYSGARPSHPELLDWLATEFVRESWSIKKLHRLIVTSAAYRQSSQARNDERSATGIRPQVRRLDAEQLRDSLLAVSGLLKTHEAGRPLWPAVPDELLKAQPAILEAEKGGDGGRMQGWYTDPLEATDVRSVFLVRKRAVAVPFLQTFDLPDTTVSCARRDSTVVAPQALLLLNSPESVRFAEALADRVTRLAGPDADARRRIDTAFRETLGRLPDDEERRLAEDLLARHGKVHAKALVDLCRA